MNIGRAHELNITANMLERINFQTIDISIIHMCCFRINYLYYTMLNVAHLKEHFFQLLGEAHSINNYSLNLNPYKFALI